jgi:Sulfotransferase family
MSIINTTFGFIFVHVPKCAGTSVTSVLSRLCTVLDIEIGGSVFGEAIQPAYQKRHGITKHSTARELRALLGEQLWLKYTSFGVVRHPLDRLLSAYRFLRQWDSPSNWMRAQMMEFQSFADFVASDIWTEDDGLDRLFRPQAFWLADPNKDELLVDRILHTETLNADLERLLLDLGVPRSRMPTDAPHLNATKETDTLLDLGNELLDKVRTRYARDLRMFGYVMDSVDKARRIHAASE